MARRGIFWPTAMTAIALVAFVSLGLWQAHRMEWKRALLERISGVIAAPAIGFDLWWAQGGGGIGNSEFSHVSLKGVFRHENERYVFTLRNGQVGYLVFTPLELAPCPAGAPCAVWINRGFVPEALRDPASRPQGQASGEAMVSGLTRLPEQAGWFTPAPDEAKRVWYAATFPDRFYIEADAAPNPGGWPKGRDPKELLASIPNRHAEYAFTWFSLALVLLIVYGFYLRSQARAH